jgi:hypothetical protein
MIEILTSTAAICGVDIQGWALRTGAHHDYWVDLTRDSRRYLGYCLLQVSMRRNIMAWLKLFQNLIFGSQGRSLWGMPERGLTEGTPDWGLKRVLSATNVLADVVGSDATILTVGSWSEWLDFVSDASLAGDGFDFWWPPITPTLVDTGTSPFTEAPLRSSIVFYNLILAQICEEREAGS